MHWSHSRLLFPHLVYVVYVSYYCYLQTIYEPFVSKSRKTINLIKFPSRVWSGNLNEFETRIFHTYYHHHSPVNFSISSSIYILRMYVCSSLELVATALKDLVSPLWFDAMHFCNELNINLDVPWIKMASRYTILYYYSILVTYYS